MQFLTTNPFAQMIKVGTSGYSYPYWKNRFYPEKLPASRWLQYYATRFSAIELNSSFYRFPTVANLKKAAAQTPGTFTFSIKAHKIITHTLRMKNVRDKITDFMNLAEEGLASQLGAILYQLPPGYSFTEERLADVIDNLSADKRNVAEFRHASWWRKDVYALLDKSNIHFCSVSYPGLPADDITTGHVFYKRMHGVPQLFKSSYKDDELGELAKHISPNTKKGFVFFNNTMYEAGYSNALVLQELLK